MNLQPILVVLGAFRSQVAMCLNLAAELAPVRSMPLVLVEVAVVGFRHLLEEALLEYSMGVELLDFESFLIFLILHHRRQVDPEEIPLNLEVELQVVVVDFAMYPHCEEEEVTCEMLRSSSTGFRQRASPGTAGLPPAPRFLQVRLSCSQRFPSLTAPRRSPSRS